MKKLVIVLSFLILLSAITSAASPIGSSCYSNSACESNNCYNTRCSSNAIGSNCNSNSACTTNNCVGGRCTSNAIGSSCTSNANCESNNCFDAKCMASTSSTVNKTWLDDINTKIRGFSSLLKTIGMNKINIHLKKISGEIVYLNMEVINGTISPLKEGSLAKWDMEIDMKEKDTADIYNSKDQKKEIKSKLNSGDITLRGNGFINSIKVWLVPWFL